MTISDVSRRGKSEPRLEGRPAATAYGYAKGPSFQERSKNDWYDRQKKLVKKKRPASNRGSVERTSLLF